MRRFITVMMLPLLLAGCGSGTGHPRHLGMRNRTVISAEEIALERVSAWTAHDVISRLRPEFLRSRGRSSLRTTVPTTAVVYLDEVRYGALDSLRQLSADQIYSIQYINAADATTRFGTDHLGGAILITTK